MLHKIVIAVMAMAMLFVFTGSGTAAEKIGVSYAWDDDQGSKPSSSVSPAITLTNVPADTVKITVDLVDEDRPRNNHGDGSIAYSGPGGTVKLEKGAISGLRGPAPPAFERHTYTITVTTQNRDGKTTAKGTGSDSCCR